MSTIFTRVESRECYPVPERPHYTIKLSKGEVIFHLQGKEMSDEQIGDVIVRLINALNTAEKQIDMFFKMLKESSAVLDSGESLDYLEEYPEEENYTEKYKVEDLKDFLFHAMMRKDEKLIGKYINQINVLESKSEVPNG